jgi:hypothetical protein
LRLHKAWARSSPSPLFGVVMPTQPSEIAGRGFLCYGDPTCAAGARAQNIAGIGELREYEAGRHDGARARRGNP